MELNNLRNRLTYRVDLPDGQRRLKELVLYIADKCETDERFGATKLNKILFYSDFRSFRKYGRPITGEKYKSLDRGPAPLAMVPVQREMVQSSDIVIRKKSYHGKEQHRVTPLREADIEIFSGRDIAIVDEVIDELWEWNAVQASEKSHGIQWRTSHIGDLIPYESAHLSDEEITGKDVGRTLELSEEFGWHDF
jgi:hypothetical protein